MTMEAVNVLNHIMNTNKYLGLKAMDGRKIKTKLFQFKIQKKLF